MHIEATPPSGDAAVVVHPGWCDRGECVVIDGVRQHWSAPVVVRARNACLRLAWVLDEFARESEPGESPELRIEVVPARQGQGPMLYLSPAEVSELAARLVGLYWQNHYQGAPVVAS